MVDIIDLLSDSSSDSDDDDDNDDDHHHLPTSPPVAATAKPKAVALTKDDIKSFKEGAKKKKQGAKNNNNSSAAVEKANHYSGHSPAAAATSATAPEGKSAEPSPTRSSVGDTNSASKKSRGSDDSAKTASIPTSSSSSKPVAAAPPQNLKNPPPSSVAAAATTAATATAKVATDYANNNNNLASSSSSSKKSMGVAATVAKTLSAGLVTFTSALKSMTTSSQHNSSSSSLENADPNAKEEEEGRRGHNKSPLHDDDDDDNDDDNDDNKEEYSLLLPPPRCVAALQQQCWSPHCQVQLNQGFYALHAHLLLHGVPMCSVCAEEVEAVEQARLTKLDNDSREEASSSNKEKDVEDEEKEDFCAGCAIGESSGELLFLCDNQHQQHGDNNNNHYCGRAFCQSCLAQAFGGGVQGWKQTKRLAAAPEDYVWKCLACQPTETLQALAQVIFTMQTTTSSSQDPQDKAESNEPHRGTAAEVFDKILVIEEERQKTTDLLDGESEKLDEIRQELKFNNPSIANDDLEEAALEEWEEWNDQLLKHDRRLVDLLTALQDEFQHIFGMDLAHAYEQAGLVVRPKLSTKDNDDDADDDNPDDEDVLDNDPDWVRRANEAIQRRDARQMRQRKLAPPLLFKPSNSQEEIEGYQDIDVLADLEQGDSTVLATGFEACQEKILIDDEGWAELEREESEYLKRKKIQSRIHEPKTELDDVEETRHEEVRESRPGTNGVARIVTRTLQPRRRNRSGTPAATNKQGPNPTTPIETDESRDKKPAPAPPKQDEDIAATSTAAVGTPSGSKSLHRAGTPGSTASSRKVAATPNHSTDSTSYDSTPGSQRKLRGAACSDLQLCKKSGVFKCSVAVDPQLTKHLKAHQREGVEFMFNNSFVDLVQKEGHKSESRGSILAHHMGLGKSLTSIALVHTLLAHDLVTTVLLVVPVNTITNWKDEITTWTGNGMKSPCIVYDFSEVQAFARDSVLNNWTTWGGILIISPGTLVSHMKDIKKCSDKLIECDMVVVDEGHLCLKSTTTLQAKKLDEIKTKRRIVLTGTPLSNNLLEYYNVASYVQPGCLGKEAEFEREFKDPIEKGMASDVSPSAALLSQQKSAELHQKLAAIVNRKDASVLRQVLPPLQQVVLHVRPTRVQSQIYNEYKKFQRRKDSKNFFKAYQALRPINNHPGCIIVKANEDLDRENSAKKKSANSEDKEEKDDDPDNRQFHDSIRENRGDEVLLNVDSGAKFVLLLHLLALAAQQNEKVLIFSNCLRTLSFIETVLGYPDWKEHVPSLASTFPDALGGWEKGKDFYRIDGGICGSDRGDIVKKFNSDGSRTLLLSMQAGGIGTNLTAATRVVLMDTHFNPSILEQAIARCHRFGQNQPVFAYRLLTAGSVEEKVYARTVTKSGVASRVVDNKTMERFFTAREISDLQTTNTWVQCDHCEKWRMMLGGVEEEELPEEWFCEMNANDPDNNNCDAEEKGELWYANRLASAQQLDAAQVLFGLSTAPPPANDFNSADSSLSKEDTQRLVDKDPVLKHLLKITENKKKSTLVSRHYFHEALMQIQDIDEEPEQDSKVAASNAHAVGADSKKSKKRATLENISSKASKHPRSESPKKSKGLEDDSVDYARAGDSKTSVAPHSNDKKRARSLPPAGRRQTPTPSKKSAENRDDMPRRNTPGKSPASRDLFRVKSEKDSVPTTSPSPRKNPPRAGRSPTGEPAAAVGAAAAVAPSRRSSKTRETGQAAKRVKKEPKVGGKGGKENAIEISDSPAVAKKPPPCEKKPETIELLDDSDDDEDETPSYNYEMTV